MFPQLRNTSTESVLRISLFFWRGLSESTPESSLIFSIRNHFKAVPYPGSGNPVKVDTNDGLDGVTLSGPNSTIKQNHQSPLSALFWWRGRRDSRTRGLCRDSVTRNGNRLKLRGTDGSPKPRKGTFRTNKWTIIGPRFPPCYLQNETHPGLAISPHPQVGHSKGHCQTGCSWRRSRLYSQRYMTGFGRLGKLLLSALIG